MKRAILIEVLLFFAFAVTIFFCGWFLKLGIEDLYWAKLDVDPEYMLKWGTQYLIFGLLTLLAAAADIVAMVLIALKEFPVFKPFIDRHNARKQQRKEAQALQAEADRQARIEALEAELDELKKNE